MPFISAGIALCSVALDNKIYKCPLSGGVACSIDEYTQSGICGSWDCYQPSSQETLAIFTSFQTVKTGLVCTIHSTNRSVTKCHVYYGPDRCKVGTCIRTYLEDVRNTTEIIVSPSSNSSSIKFGALSGQNTTSNTTVNSQASGRSMGGKEKERAETSLLQPTNVTSTIVVQTTPLPIAQVNKLENVTVEVSCCACF